MSIDKNHPAVVAARNAARRAKEEPSIYTANRCHHALDDLLAAIDPAPVAEGVCSRCGATSELDAEAKCIPSGDGCPGTDEPLASAQAKPAPVADADADTLDSLRDYLDRSGYKHWLAAFDRALLAAKPAPVADGVDWRALYRFQTAMRYMDADAKLTRDKAYAMADQDVAGLLAAQEKKS